MVNKCDEIIFIKCYEMKRTIGGVSLSEGWTEHGNNNGPVVMLLLHKLKLPDYEVIIWDLTPFNAFRCNVCEGCTGNLIESA